MATQTLRFHATTGLAGSLAPKVYAEAALTALVQTASSVTENPAGSGVYYAVFTDLPATGYELNAFIGAIGGFAIGLYDVLLATGTYRERNVSLLQTKAQADADQVAVLAAIEDIEGGGLTGEFTYTITVEDSSDDEPIEGAIVRLYRSGHDGTEPTGVDGIATLGLDAATWNYVVSASGYTSVTGSFAVTANGSRTIQLTSIVITPPADPTLATLSVLCVDEYGLPEPGVTIYAKLSRIPNGGEGIAYDGTAQDAVSGSNGIASLTVVRLATYLVKRGTGKQWTSVAIADEATTEVTSFVGSP